MNWRDMLFIALFGLVMLDVFIALSGHDHVHAIMHAVGVEP